MFKKYFSFFLLLLPFISYGQATFPDTVIVCQENSSVQVSGYFPNTLGVDFETVNEFGSITGLSDDTHTGAIPIGFPFEYFGNSYTSVVASTNGYLSFNITNAGAYSPWSITAPAPSNATTYNAIHGPYSDVLPTAASEIDWALLGTAPNRVFVVTWDNIGMFGCNDLCYYNTIMLFETSNEIINSIGQYEVCSSWNGGVAVQGVIDESGSPNSVITNDPISGVSRNFPNTFSSAGDAVKYTPTIIGGSATYTYQFITYTSPAFPEWFDRNGNSVGQGFSLNLPIPPIDSLPYKYTIILNACDQYWEDEVLMVDGTPQETLEITNISCEGDVDGQISYDANGGENKDWTVTLTDENGNLVGQYNGDNLPVTFSNLPYGIYDLIANSPTTCETEHELLVGIEYFQPQEHAVINDVLCYGEASGEILFSPHGGFNTGWSVDVYNASGNIVKTLNSNTVPINIDGLEAGTYSLVTTSPTTCIDTVEYTVDQPEPLYFYKAEKENNNCGDFTGFYDYIPANGTSPYSYYVNGKKVINLTETQVANGNYELKVIDESGCEIVANIEILDMYSPIVDFDMPVEVNLADGAVSFTDLTETNPHTTLTNWHWEFGDSEVSFEQNPKHTYSDIGEYKVYLFATDATGCQEFIVKTIRVVKPEFVLPTVFTPNGDGNNEIFIPVLDKIVPDDFKITISDRWGRIVYSSTNIFEGWDGRDTKGNIAEGSYIWIAEFKDKYGHEHISDGIVQLIR